MKFEQVLLTVQHNQHYLNRYIRFINARINREQISCGEVHHICPQAKDMFPEYKSLKVNEWNKIKLTHKEHFIAHKLLYKSYGKSQAFAFWSMCTKQSKDNSRVYKVTAKDYELAKLAMSSELSRRRKGVKNPKLSAARKNLVQAKDINGNIVCVSKLEFDSRSDLVGLMKGTKLSEETKQKIRDGAIDQSDYVHVMNIHTKKRSFVPNTKLEELGPNWVKGFTAIYDRSKYQTICHHCSKSFDNSNYKRWHGDNCKLRML